MAIRANGSTNAVPPVTGAGLAARRRALGLSQNELGRKLGVPRNTVARWERGDLRVARPAWLELALTNLEGRSSTVHSILPAELSTFVGREHEIRDGRALLSRAR